MKVKWIFSHSLTDRDSTDTDTTARSKTCYLDRSLEKNNIVRICCDSAYLFVSVVGSLFPNTQLYIYVRRCFPLGA